MSTWNELADKMLAADGPAALVCRQWLMPADGRDAVIFPPTFAPPEGKAGPADYISDPLGDSDDAKASLVELIDSVGSQATRMEPPLKREKGPDTAHSRTLPQNS